MSQWAIYSSLLPRGGSLLAGVEQPEKGTQVFCLRGKGIPLHYLFLFNHDF